MKRAFLCFLICFLLAGCGKEEATSAPVTDEMRQAVNSLQLYLAVDENGRKSEALLSREGELLQLSYCSPEELNGLTVTAENGEVSLAFLGLVTEGVTLPQECLFSFLQRLFSEFEDPSLFYLSTPEGYVVETASGEILLHRESFLPLRISNREGRFVLTAAGE